MTNKLIGRKKEINNLIDLYNSDYYIINIYGPPNSGKSTVINSFLNNNIETSYIIDFSVVNWLSITDVYVYFKKIFYLEIDDIDTDITDLAFMFNKILLNLSFTEKDYIKIYESKILDNMPVLWLKNFDLLFSKGSIEYHNSPKYLFWIFLNTICKLQICKILLSVKNPNVHDKKFDIENISLKIPYLSYDDSILYWKHLCNKDIIKNMYNITAGDPIAIKLLATTNLSTFTQKYSLKLLKIKKVFGDDIYTLFINNKGSIDAKLLNDVPNQELILNSKYVYNCDDKIYLNPAIIYVISKSIKY